MFRRNVLLLIACLVMPAPGMAVGTAEKSYYLEDLTWTEVRQRMRDGTDTIIIPTGGTEQNGPHIAIGKHNWIVRYTSGEIARQLGNALAAPVLAYVPEGDIDKPQGHMAFPGTISVREESFAMILEDAARSFKTHGFKHICFIGDSGGNQSAQAKVAEKLTKEWQNDGVTVLNVSDYYTNAAAERWIETQQIAADNVNAAAHGGFMDTSETLAVHKRGVRIFPLKSYSKAEFTAKGAPGDPSKASESYGQQLLMFKVKAAVEQIRRAFPPAGK